MSNLDLPMPLVELGEVLVQWGEHRHIVKLPIRQANELDDAMLAENPDGDGLRGFIAGSYLRHSRKTCAEMIKKIFAANDIPLSDDDLDDIQAEFGLPGFKDLAVSLIVPSLMGKKRLLEVKTELEAKIKEVAAQATASPGADTTAPQ